MAMPICDIGPNLKHVAGVALTLEDEYGRDTLRIKQIKHYDRPTLAVRFSIHFG
jgi:hypothetical protein